MILNLPKYKHEQSRFEASKLTGLERDKIKEKHAELMKTISHLKSILENENMRMNIIKELIEVKEKFGDEEGQKLNMLVEIFD